MLTRLHGQWYTLLVVSHAIYTHDAAHYLLTLHVAAAFASYLSHTHTHTHTDCPTFMDGVTRDDVILHAALAAKRREPPKDALDTMVLGVADLDKCDAYKQVKLYVCAPLACRDARAQLPCSILRCTSY